MKGKKNSQETTVTIAGKGIVDTAPGNCGLD